MTVVRLYKYGRLTEHSEALFTAGAVWFSRPVQFNDPFECAPWYTFTHDPNQIMEQLIRTIKKNKPYVSHDNAVAEAAGIYLEGRHRDPQMWENLRNDLSAEYRRAGLYCLAETRDSILMWSHYAADHCGYCVEFEATDYTPVFGNAQQVRYSDAYPEIDFYNTSGYDKVSLTFLTKFTDWSYEKEWRIIDHDLGPGLREYPPELMRSVTFGLRMSERHKGDIRSWIQRRGTPVRFFQATQSRQKFQIELESLS